MTNMRNRVINKDKYVVDLQRLQGLCTRNYALLLRLLPLQYELGQQWQIKMPNGLYFELSVLEISAYTESYKLAQKAWAVSEESIQSADANRPLLPGLINMEFEFRVYHDAQMLEVISYQKQTRIRANNPYPNEHLHHKDEKLQVNQLLKDWLSLAVKHQSKNNNKTLLEASTSE